MATHLDCVVVDANDASQLSRSWFEATGWAITFQDRSAATGWPVVVHGPGLAMLRGARRPGRFSPSSRRPSPNERLVGPGAARADVGQQDVSWVVLADPEGHEFCVLTPHRACSRA